MGLGPPLFCEELWWMCNSEISVDVLYITVEIVVNFGFFLSEKVWPPKISLYRF
jgi:hypothetical protein